MNDFLLIFMGIFILLLIFLIFILLAYVYHTYTTYTVDINKNLETSEDAINNTSTAFNKLQDSVINELAKVNKNQETIITTLPDNLISLNSNLLNIFEISSNNNKITDITKTKIDYDSLGVLKPFTSYKNFTTITDATNNFLTICNNKTDPSKKACIRMNIDDSDMFNIYTSNINRNSSNVLGINIYDSNNGVLASFDAFNRKILLGSGSSETAAISINNNVYTPNIIVCKYSYTTGTAGTAGTAFVPAVPAVFGADGISVITAAIPAIPAVPAVPDVPPKITLNIISNIPINTSTFINLPIFDTFNITIANQGQANTISYVQNILKFKPGANIAKNTIANIIINISNLIGSPNQSTTTGYITAT